MRRSPVLLFFLLVLTASVIQAQTRAPPQITSIEQLMNAVKWRLTVKK